MVQFGPVDVFWYTATNVSTSKIFMFTFCSRKWDVEKCLGSTQETYGVRCFLGRDSFRPAELAPGEVSYSIFACLNFCIFFPSICVSVSVKGEAYHEAKESKSTCEMTDLLGAKRLLGLWWWIILILQRWGGLFWCAPPKVFKENITSALSHLFCVTSFAVRIFKFIHGSSRKCLLLQNVHYKLV